MYKLIVGASGYLGKAVEKKLTKQGFKVVGNNSDQKDNSHILRLDNLDLAKIPKNVDEAILLAGISGKAVALNPVLSNKINVENTKLLIDELIQREIVINYISSSAVFNSSQNFANESDFPKPLSLYGQQKLSIENYLYENCKNQEQFRIIRPTKILSLDSNLISSWLNKSKAGTEIEINPAVNISPISLQSFVDSFFKIFISGSYEIFHLSGAETLNLYDFVKTLSENIIFARETNIKIYESSYDNNANILGMQETFEKVGVQPLSLKSLYDDLTLI